MASLIEATKLMKGLNWIGNYEIKLEKEFNHYLLDDGWVLLREQYHLGQCVYIFIMPKE